MKPRMYGVVVGALLLVALALPWDGSGAVEKPEGGRVLVTFEEGLLTVLAREVALKEVFQAIAAHTGIELIAVNPPTGWLNLTVTVERQPLEQAIRSIVQSIPLSGPLSYAFTSDQGNIRAVHIIFPVAHEGPAPEPGRLQESPAAGGEPGVQSRLVEEKAPAPEGDPSQERPHLGGEPTVQAPAAEERVELTEVLQVAGVSEEQLDPGQLSDVKQLIDQGMSLHEILRVLPPSP